MGLRGRVRGRGVNCKNIVDKICASNMLLSYSDLHVKLLLLSLF